MNFANCDRVSSDASEIAVYLKFFSFLQQKLAVLENVDAEDFLLSCEGKILASTDPITALTSCELDLTVSLLGGKVHGSLARAGRFIIFYFLICIFTKF